MPRTGQVLAILFVLTQGSIVDYDTLLNGSKRRRPEQLKRHGTGIEAGLPNLIRTELG